MLKHLFKLIWNKKRQNFLLMTEILVSFMVIFAVFSLLVNYYMNYRKPMGFEYDRVWSVEYRPGVSFKTKDSLVVFYDNLRNKLNGMPEIEGITFVSDNSPFTANTRQSNVDYKKQHARSVNWYDADSGYPNTMKVKVLEGRWFGKQDDAATVKPVVINQQLRNELFGAGKALGERIGEEQRFRVVGVVNDIKDKGDFSSPGNGMYQRLDTSNLGWVNKLLVRVSAKADPAFESRLYRAMSNSFKNSNIDINHLTAKLEDINKQTLIPMIILLIVAGFLIINVALGLFGVLWYNINSRRSEIGLRRAIGATGKNVSAQLVTESVILATISLVIGSFFAAQFPLLNVFDLQSGVYVTAILLSVVFIYLLILACSLYPGKQAAAIYPAIALHEE
ncbi:ABC transporter permease [Hufsiella ginkgonis]|uniref:FtsX-like permease family protein n=1 Tax=Hufsiella ginkgonis TaxID=2695274 RepID=A0A7K1XX21_9SPHI|nr:FtsX-like permease family protein [Hufsiella ginkgonis]MXV15066.1 FtsX-like permease family protein [Hufsiella ginkgonis]